MHASHNWKGGSWEQTMQSPQSERKESCKPGYDQQLWAECCARLHAKVGIRPLNILEKSLAHICTHHMHAFSITVVVVPQMWLRNRFKSIMKEYSYLIYASVFPKMFKLNIKFMLGKWCLRIRIIIQILF